jgi:hypothetical protein
MTIWAWLIDITLHAKVMMWVSARKAIMLTKIFKGLTVTIFQKERLKIIQILDTA